MTCNERESQIAYPILAPAPAPTPAELPRFREWFIANGGVIHPSVELAYNDVNGVYLRVQDEVTGSLPKGTVVIRCPHVLRLSAQDAVAPLRPRAEGSYFPLPQSIVGTARPQTANALWLCCQYLLGSQSPWHEYISLLPPPPRQSDKEREQATVAGLETPLFWPKEDRDLLQNSNLWKGIHDLEELWMKEWTQSKDEISAWEASGAPIISWDLFKWALVTLGARAFTSAWFRDNSTSMTPTSTYDPHMFLYPGIDLLNHSPRTKNIWVCIDDSFCIRCNDEPRAGDEVFNWYGNKGNAELLLSYGFSVPDNQHDTFAIKLKERAYPLRDAVKRGHPSGLEDGQHNQASRNDDTLPKFGDSQLIFKDVSLLRHPDCIPPAPSGSILDQNFPIPHDDKYTPQFAGVPPALLSRLAETLTNQRERTMVEHDLANFSTVYLFRQLGRRVELRVTAMLLQMLHREHHKVKSIIIGLRVQRAQQREMESGHQDPIAPKRNHFTTVYLDGQDKILTAITSALRTALVRALAEPPLPQTRLSNSVPGSGCAEMMVTQGEGGGRLFTLNAALSLFEKLSPALAASYKDGLTILVGGADAALVRASDNEDEIWGIWLHLLHNFLHGCSAAHSSSNGAIASSSNSDGDLALESQLTKWWTIIERAYSVGIDSAAVPAARSHNHNEQPQTHTFVQVEKDAGHMELEMQQYIEYVRSLAKSIRVHNRRSTAKAKDPAWSSAAWNDSAVIRLCMCVVQQEMFRIPLWDDSGTAIVGEELVLYIDVPTASLPPYV